MLASLHELILLPFCCALEVDLGIGDIRSSLLHYPGMVMSFTRVTPMVRGHLPMQLDSYFSP